MARTSGQKLKILYLMEFLLQQTDEKHSVTVQDMIEHLAGRGIAAERKSIYSDLEVLRTYGLNIVSARGKGGHYYVADRRLQLPELKLLVDAIQGSRFITHRKSHELIKKIESFASVHEAQQLQRQVYVANRIKTMNESIYYNIDTLHEAISGNRQISFLYYEWAVDFSRQEKIVRCHRRGGKRYVMSPWTLSWNEENYYLLAYDAEAGVIKHFRVDKMSDLQISEEPRLGREQFENFDMALYSKKLFGMFGGEEELVQIAFDNSLIGVVVDRFGRDVHISPCDDGRFQIAAKVAVSPQFWGWVLGFGERAEIIGPDWVRRRLTEHTEKILRQYQDDE